MPIKHYMVNHKTIKSDGKREMTLNEFGEWLKQFDADCDGRISREELREAIKFTSGRWSAWLHSKRGVKIADKDESGFIEKPEMKNLEQFAEKYLNIRIVSY